MRFLRFALAAASLAAAATAFASPTDPRLNADYTMLAQPQPTQASGKKVEVLEFFMYRCPHCAALEPELEAWAKRQGDNVVLRRVHFPYSGPKDPGAHLYVTLEAMGKAEELSQKIFDAIHKQRIRLDNNEQAIFDFVAKNGVDLAKFKEVWSSFSVLTKMNRLNSVVSTYKVETAPTLIIDGKYVTSPGDIGQANHIADEPTLMKTVPQVLDALVAKAKASKK
ncbi:MAG TPA: thiol:disulfide interchange protein DsbA/DsbL [Telluria sp.]|nr:thiol:disulfide interchange protein DsbA/DsbL [Telluria sp.]